MDVGVAPRGGGLGPGESPPGAPEGLGFVSGTRLGTVRGDVAVEKLQAGDLLVTPSGTPNPVRRIRAAAGTAGWPSRDPTPVHVAAHAFGPERPARALLLSPDHAVCVDCLGEVLIPIRALCNDATIVAHDVPAAGYRHVELERCDLVVAENLAVENTSPGVAGDAAAAPLPRADTSRPLRTEGPIVDIVRTRLARRAAALGWTETTAFEVHLEMGGRRLEPTLSGLTARFMLPAAAGDAWLVAPTARPNQRPATRDTRDLGLDISSLRIVDGFTAPQDIPVDDPRLWIGFRPSCGGSRWTSGRAHLPAALWRDRAELFFLVVELAGPPLPRWRAPPADAPRAAPAAPALIASDPARRILYWCADTLRLGYETGIQRVTRRLGRGLSACGLDVVPVGWDRRSRQMVALEADGSVASRGVDALIRSARRTPWLVVPEMPLDLTRDTIDPVHIGRAYGLATAALLHDLIPLKQERFYGDDFLRAFRRYARTVYEADLVLTSTRWVADDLRTHAEAAGATVPSIAVVPFGAQFADLPRSLACKPDRAPGEPLRLLAVSTWEPRKNLPRLLRAVRAAEAATGAAIELASVGQRGLHPAYDAEVEALGADMPGFTWHGSLPDAELAALFARSHASVYPSYEEGFGLPVMESLWLATPCVCHDGSSLAEIAPGGGALAVDMTDEAALARALAALIEDRDLLPRLAAELRVRPLRDWNDYAREVAGRLAGSA